MNVLKKKKSTTRNFISGRSDTQIKSNDKFTEACRFSFGPKFDIAFVSIHGIS